MPSRTDYPAMARFAVASRERGHTDREVIRECFGVEFPVEYFVIARGERLELGIDCTNLPWQLTIPPALGGPTAKPHSTWSKELLLFDLDPLLVPLGELHDFDAVHGGSLVCYHLDELAAGRSTVLGLPVDFDRNGEDAVPVRVGASLLDVLHEYESDRQRMIEEQHEDPKNATGFGSVSSEYVEQCRADLRRVEELQRVCHKGNT